MDHCQGNVQSKTLIRLFLELSAFCTQLSFRYESKNVSYSLFELLRPSDAELTRLPGATLGRACLSPAPHGKDRRACGSAVDAGGAVGLGTCSAFGPFGGCLSFEGGAVRGCSGLFFRGGESIVIMSNLFLGLVDCGGTAVDGAGEGAIDARGAGT